jgi:hypothetical protein
VTTMSRVETLVQRRQTTAYLNAEPRDVVLLRSDLQDDGAGGKIESQPVPLAPQVFRLVPFKRRLTHTQSTITEGTVTVSSYALVGRWDADVQKGDEFVLDGGRYRVESVEPGRDYRTLADVTYRGADEN